MIESRVPTAADSVGVAQPRSITPRTTTIMTKKGTTYFIVRIIFSEKIRLWVHKEEPWRAEPYI